VLLRLHIENYALIDKLDFEPSSQGLNILTGETGAGKSIIIGALGLVLGERADSSVLRDLSRKCIVEAHFDLSSSSQLVQVLTEKDLDVLDPTIIRREINPAGRSRAFVNDTPVQLSTLKELSVLLVDVHSQHQTQKLKEASFQYRILDSFSGSNSNVADYQTQFAKLKEMRAELEKLQQAQVDFDKEKDYKSFLFDELYAASLDDLDPESLEANVLQLENAEELQKLGAMGSNLIEENEQSITDQLASFKFELTKLSSLFPHIKQIEKSLDSVVIELKEMALELRSIAESSDVNPEHIEDLNQKLTDFRSLLSKHHVNELTDLRRIRDELDDELQTMDLSSDRIGQLERETTQLQESCKLVASEIHKNRKAIIPQLEEAWQGELEQLGMPNASIKFELTPLETLNKWGSDKLTILFSPNKGGRFEPLHKVASGGELSRVMLIVKSYLARFSTLPTMVLDEIDTGVSGETAKKVADMMARISNNHQLITITHLPQIAAKGKKHYFVYKQDQGDQTHSFIKELSEDERIEEIAVMLSGENPSEHAKQNAKELIGA